MKSQLDIWGVEHPLEYLAIPLNESGPNGFGLVHHPADRPLQGSTIYPALDPDQTAKLPLRSGVTRFLRKPYL